MKITKPIKVHGGKDDLATRIVALMPERCLKPNDPDPKDKGWLHYVEPYFGGGSVMLAMDPHGISEVAGDTNGKLMSFWAVLADLDQFLRFKRHVQATPFSNKTYNEAALNLTRRFEDKPYWEKAVDFFVASRQSLAGRMKGFASITRNRTRKGMNEQVAAWLGAIEGLDAVHERMKRVLITTDDALDVIRREDGERTLFYLDPPYLHETRATTKEYGLHEMGDAEHMALLALLATLTGRFLLSGYRSKLYDRWAKSNKWRRVDFDVPNNAAGGKTKRRMVESVWMNYNPGA